MQLQTTIKRSNSNQISPNAYTSRGISNAELERHEVAIEDYDKAIQLKPDVAEAYSNRGDSNAELGQFDDAIVDFDKAIQLNPDLAERLLQPRSCEEQIGTLRRCH